jgi:uncharacterized protein (TIGR02996 family)
MTPRVVSSAKQLASLRVVDDPQLGRWALDALADPPFCAVSGEPFLRSLIDTVERLRDGRVASELPQIREVLRARLVRKPMYERLLRRLELVAKQQVAPQQTSAERDVGRRLPREQTSEQLLNNVYADPDDDTPRRVYADYLLGRGDPRGEFIALQLSRRRDDAPTARELDLLTRYGRNWLGPLAIIVRWGKRYAKTRFERGFLAHADIIDHAEKKAALLAENPAWSTVESFELYFLPKALLLGASLRSLRAIERQLNEQELHELAQRASPLSRVERIEIELVQKWPARLLEVLPKLTQVVVGMPGPLNAGALRAILSVPGVLMHLTNFGSATRAGERRHTRELVQLEGCDSRLSALTVDFPWRKKEAPPAHFVRDSAGRLRRVR